MSRCDMVLPMLPRPIQPMVVVFIVNSLSSSKVEENAGNGNYHLVIVSKRSVSIFGGQVALRGFLLLHTATGVLHSRAVHTLSFEEVEVHFTEAICEDQAEELRIFKPIVFLCKELAAAILIRPAGAEDIRHAGCDRGCLVFEEGLFDGQIDPTKGLDIPLRRTLGRRVGRPELVLVGVHRKVGL